MKLGRILAVLAGAGAVAGAAAWAKKNYDVKVDVRPEDELSGEELPEEPEEGATGEELDAARAANEARTEAELKAAEGNALKTGLALAKGWLRRHIIVVVSRDGEAGAEAEPSAPAGEEAAPAADAPDAPNPNPVEAAPAAAPVQEDGRLDATKLASPEDFAPWDEQGCQG